LRPDRHHVSTFSIFHRRLLTRPLFPSRLSIFSPLPVLGTSGSDTYHVLTCEKYPHSFHHFTYGRSSSDKASVVAGLHWPFSISCPQSDWVNDLWSLFLRLKQLAKPGDLQVPRSEDKTGLVFRHHWSRARTSRWRLYLASLCSLGDVTAGTIRDITATTRFLFAIGSLKSLYAEPYRPWAISAGSTRVSAEPCWYKQHTFQSWRVSWGSVDRDRPRQPPWLSSTVFASRGLWKICSSKAEGQQVEGVWWFIREERVDEIGFNFTRLAVFPLSRNDAQPHLRRAKYGA